MHDKHHYGHVPTPMSNYTAPNHSCACKCPGTADRQLVSAKRQQVLLHGLQLTSVTFQALFKTPKPCAPDCSMLICSQACQWLTWAAAVALSGTHRDSILHGKMELYKPFNSGGSYLQGRCGQHIWPRELQQPSCPPRGSKGQHSSLAHLPLLALQD